MHLAGRASVAVAAAALLLLAAACAPVAPPAPPPPAEAPAEIGPPPLPTAALPPRPARKPAPPHATEPAALPGVPDAASTGGFERLNGLDQSATLALLGAPRQRADAPPATIWRYVTGSCELDVYFYLDLRSREMHVLHYEFRTWDHDAADRTQQRCYEQLVGGHAAAESTVGADRTR